METETDEIETIEAPPPESVFSVAARKTPLKNVEIRALFEVLDVLAPHVTEPDAHCIQADGTPIDGWQCYTAVVYLSRTIGPFHGAIQAVKHALREELR
jgi:hypothetical protein